MQSAVMVTCVTEDELKPEQVQKGLTGMIRGMKRLQNDRV